MDAKEILELLRAGYTKAEITAMTAEPLAEPEPENVIEDKNDEPTKEETKPNNENKISTEIPRGDEYQKLLDAIERLTGAVITKNINTRNMADDEINTRTPESIIAGMVQGKKPGKEK